MKQETNTSATIIFKLGQAVATLGREVMRITKRISEARSREAVLSNCGKGKVNT